MEYTFPVIGIVHSCFMAKFGVPRQPRLIHEAAGYIELQPPYNQPNCVRGLEEFSHIWVLFVFHQNLREGWKATVRPPRLGGDKRIGVFASRSSFRPSPIGMSVMELAGVEQKEHGIIRIHVRGLDVVDGTPVIDIKPYIPYSDSHPDAKPGFSVGPDKTACEVVFSDGVVIDDATKNELNEILRLDPRPGYKNDGNVYKMSYGDMTVSFKFDGNVIFVLNIC